jgi:hypothetical protein
MKKFIYLITCIPVGFAFAQNVGIGTSAPTGPLSFANVLGNKIVLWGDGSTGHYGLGVQSGQLQVYSDLGVSNISFGFGRSGNFTERVRVVNAGGNGLLVNGRIEMRNGSNPLDQAFSTGIWMYKADNSALLGFMGVQNNQNVGFYGGPALWGFVYDAINSRVGIGNDNPAFRLDLAGRMRIRAGGDGEPGIFLNNTSNTGLASFIGLQDNSRVGFYGTGGIGWGFTMNTANGALAVNGNSGAAGQVLTSSGAAAAPAWAFGGNQLFVATQPGNSPDLGSSGEVDIPGLVANFTLPAPARVAFFLNMRINNKGCFGCGLRRTFVYLRNASTGASVAERAVYTENGELYDLDTAPMVLDLPAGTHSYKVVMQSSIVGTATVYAYKGQLAWSYYAR